MATHSKSLGVSKVSKGVKRAFDSSGVKSVTPFRGTLTPDTLPDTCRVSQSFDACPGWTVTLRPLHTGWRASAEQRLRLALKRLLRSYGLRCVECRPCERNTGSQFKQT